MHPGGHHLFRCLIIFALLLPFSIALPLSARDTIHCVSTTWLDILGFFLINFVAHAATAPSPPGVRWWGSFQWQLFCLLFPFIGLGRAAAFIFNHCAFGEDELGKASSVGALAVAARTNVWKLPTECSEKLVCVRLPSQFREDAGSVPGAESLNPHLLWPREIEAEESPTAAVVVRRPPMPLGNWLLSPGSFFTVVNQDHTIHGNHALPDGYHWVIPSPTLCFRLVKGLTRRGETQIARSQNVLKMATSVVQLFLSCITIYRTRGSQLARYGYASFGLSAIPYAFMSLINFICVGCTGEYPYLFMLQTPTLQEAKGRAGALIYGEIGILQTAPGSQNDSGESSDAAGLGTDEGEKPQMDDGVTGSDDKYIPAWLWTEDSGELLCAKMGNSTRKFKLVEDAEDATFLFSIHPVEDRLHIYEPVAESEGRKVSYNLKAWLPLQRLVKRFRQTDDTYRTRIALGFKMLITITSPVLACVLPYTLISLLTGFQKRESTTFERLVMLSWLVGSQLTMLYGVVLIGYPNFSFPSLKSLERSEREVSMAKTGEHFSKTTWLIIIVGIPIWVMLWGLFVGFFAVVFVSPIAGFVVVGKMLHEFGTCSLIP